MIWSFDTPAYFGHSLVSFMSEEVLRRIYPDETDPNSLLNRKLDRLLFLMRGGDLDSPEVQALSDWLDDYYHERPNVEFFKEVDEEMTPFSVKDWPTE